MGQGARVTEAITGPDGRRAFLLPWKGAVYGHVLIGICAVIGERRLAAQKVHGRGQGKLVIHRHVSGKAREFPRSHDSLKGNERNEGINRR